MIRDLKENKTLSCAYDQIFCPVFINDLTGILHEALEKDLRGLYNTCSPESFSRYELALLLKTKLNIKTGEIVKCSIKDIDSPDKLAANISMNSDKIRKDTGYVFSKMSEHINKLKEIFSDI
jgi:dTDP-4-dehydrorhamnose reductase